MQYLTVYKSHVPKIRIGSAGDGGYVIVPNHKYDILISCGIANNIDFEIDFINKHNNIKCIAYDGTVDNIPKEHENITFIKKNIAINNSEITTNLHNEIEKYNNIFLKMDIETFEYRWLHTLSREQLQKFKQIVIEFHFPFTAYPFNHLDKDIPVKDKLYIFEKLFDTHRIVHFHANNCCGVTNYEGIVVPNVFECTFIRKDIFVNIGFNNEAIPSSLDYPNVNSEDIKLNWPPFVY